MERLTCNRCNTEKDTTEFHQDKRLKTGYSRTCKECTKSKRVYKNTLYSNDKLYKCVSCGEKKYINNYKIYPSGKRYRNCNECDILIQHYRTYNTWESRHIKKTHIQDFLRNLREVTGINGVDDLMNKYNKNGLNKNP